MPRYDAAPSQTHRDLWLARALTLGPVALGLPAATAAVFLLGVDRTRAADVFAVIYSVGLMAAFTTAFWPLPSVRRWSRARRVESASLVFMIVSYTTHLTWELGWLVLHDAIQRSREAAWAYPWWAYIDGGDARYAHAGPTLLAMEFLSVVNGLLGTLGLVLWRRRRDRRGVLLCMATAVVHLYSTSLYFGSELLAGLPNVNTASALDTWIKFGLANAPWLVFPWLVLAWGSGALRSPDAMNERD